MFDKHNYLEASPNKEHIVQEIIITSIVEKESTAILQADNAMKNATPLMYNCISEYREFLQNTGTCFSSLVKQNKKGKICAVFCFAGKRKLVFYILRCDCEAKNL